MTAGQNNFGTPRSCDRVKLTIDDLKALYAWVLVSTKVSVEE